MLGFEEERNADHRKMTQNFILIPLENSMDFFDTVYTAETEKRTHNRSLD